MAGREKGHLIAQGPTQPHGSLPTSPRQFWGKGDAIAALGACPVREAPPALEKLGPPPFPRGGFPLMGFLASVYEHVAARAREAESQ